jgi:hypothetical protein
MQPAAMDSPKQFEDSEKFSKKLKKIIISPVFFTLPRRKLLWRYQ